MANFNQVFLMGNITRPPELRYAPSGMAVTNITLAMNRKWKDANTEQDKEEVTFVDCTAFGRVAEVISETHKKGDPLFAVGRLRNESWEDKQTGQKRSKLSVILDSFQFIKPYEEPTDTSRPKRDGELRFEPSPRQPETAPAAPYEEDDEVPFATLNPIDLCDVRFASTATNPNHSQNSTRIQPWPLAAWEYAKNATRRAWRSGINAFLTIRYRKDHA